MPAEKSQFTALATELDNHLNTLRAIFDRELELGISAVENLLLCTILTAYMGDVKAKIDCISSCVRAEKEVNNPRKKSKAGKP